MATRRLLVLASHPEASPATRFRASLHFDELRARGIEPVLEPFVDAEFFATMYTRTGVARKALDLARFVRDRMLLLLRAGEYDAVLVQREAAFLGPEVLEAALAMGRRMPLALDIDDAVWLRPPAAPGAVSALQFLASRVLKAPGKTPRIMRMARLVLTGSEHLARYARRHARDVTVIPTVVSRERFRPTEGRLPGAIAHPSSPPVIGWIGTPSTSIYVDAIAPALTALARDGARFRVRLIGTGAREIPIEGVELERVPWSLAREVASFQELDIGLGPSAVDEWTEGKCGFKQLQYMAVGVPAVSTLVGSLRDFLRDEENALLATDTASWTKQLRRLLEDAPLRERISRAGRALVEETYSSEVQSPRFADAIDRLFRPG